MFFKIFLSWLVLELCSKFYTNNSIFSFVSSQEYLIKYRIPGANVLNWNYHPAPKHSNSVKYPISDKPFKPSFPNSQGQRPSYGSQLTSKPFKPLFPNTQVPSYGPTSMSPMKITTPPVQTTQPTVTTMNPSSHGNDDEVIIDKFLDWVDKNPDPNRNTLPSSSNNNNNNDNGGSDYYDYDEQSSEFAVLNVPQNEKRRCPTGQRLIHGSCKRVGIKFRPKPRS